MCVAPGLNGVVRATVRSRCALRSSSALDPRASDRSFALNNDATVFAPPIMLPLVN